MEGLWALLLLLFIAALPVMLVYLWVCSRYFPLSRLWFFFSLLAGGLALGIAVLFQNLLSFPAGLPGVWERHPGMIFFHVLVRIALTEEAGRLAALLLLFRLGSRIPRRFEPEGPAPDEMTPAEPSYTRAFGAAAGLSAGLGFAFIENAIYGAANPGITLLRAFTSAPLHGACGARVGIAAVSGRRKPFLALGRFISAVAIHGMYDFMVISPGLPAFILALLIAFTALASSIQLIRSSF
jgi:RsiW-degrading membrane proteinase PrsW (M82 family)